MRNLTLLCLFFVCLACFIVESEARRGGGRGGGLGSGGRRGGGFRGGGRGGYGGGRRRVGWGRGRGGYSSYSRSSYYRRPSYSYSSSSSSSYYGYGRRGGGLFGWLFGRNRGYGYNNYGYNYNRGYCRVARFVDYVGRTPRYYCDCPPYAPNYQFNQCVPMSTYNYGKK